MQYAIWIKMSLMLLFGKTYVIKKISFIATGLSLKCKVNNFIFIYLCVQPCWLPVLRKPVYQLLSTKIKPPHTSLIGHLKHVQQKTSQPAWVTPGFVWSGDGPHHCHAVEQHHLNLDDKRLIGYISPFWLLPLRLLDPCCKDDENLRRVRM